MKIKALSLWEPWASLMRSGAKTIETRSWPTSYRGPLLICGAKRWSRDQWDILHSAKFQRALLPMFPGRSEVVAQDMLLGQAAAVVDLFDCVETGNLSTVSAIGQGVYREKDFGDYSTGRHAWFTRNLRTLSPFRVAGHQGLWNIELPDHLVEQLAAL